jgi:hypothetical protein
MLKLEPIGSTARSIACGKDTLRFMRRVGRCTGRKSSPARSTKKEKFSAGKIVACGSSVRLSLVGDEQLVRFYVEGRVFLWIWGKVSDAAGCAILAIFAGIIVGNGLATCPGNFRSAYYPSPI